MLVGRLMKVLFLKTLWRIKFPAVAVLQWNLALTVLLAVICNTVTADSVHFSHYSSFLSYRKRAYEIGLVFCDQTNVLSEHDFFLSMDFIKFKAEI